MDEWTHKLNVACRHCCSPPPLSWPPIFSGDTPRVTETLIPSWIYTCPAHLQREEASTLNIYLQSIYIQGRNFGCEQYQHPLSLSLLPPLRFVYGSLNWAFSSPPPFSHESVFALICERTTYGRMPPFPSRHTPLVRTLSKQSKSEEGPFGLRAGLVHLLSLCAPFLDGPVQVLKERERSYLTSFFLFSRHENSTTFCQHIHQHLDGRISVCIYKKKKVGQPCRKFDYHPKKTGRFLLLFQLDPHCDCNPFVVGCFSFRREDLNF